MALPKKNELLRGYTLLDDFKIVGGGTCQWTFATKDGDEYFIKMFLDPKLPSPTGLGSEEVKNQRRERCRTFERHQRDLMERVRKLVGAGGNLIAPIDFFEYEGQYFKIARKVSASIGAEKEVPTRSIQDRITLCINVCSALQSLHNNKIVHGDLKLDNILLQKSPDGGFLAKVIDFDSSYVVGSPPSSEEILGDPPYYSPELLDYIQGRSTPDSLTTASDMFSLGIVFCEYLTGKKPQWTGDHNYLSEAVRAKETITIAAISEDESKQARLHEILKRMISVDSKERPTLFGLSNELKTIRDGATGPIVRAPGPGPGTDSGGTSGGDTGAIAAGTGTGGTDTSGGAAIATSSEALNDLELVVASAKKYLEIILAKKNNKVVEPAAGASRLRGALAKKAEAAPATEDNSALINAISEVAATLQRLAES
jgi:serine/threonine protein kinase